MNSGKRSRRLLEFRHGTCRNPPTEVLLSQECDLYPKNYPDRVELLDTKLGRTSRFARERGFFVDLVTPELATLPNGWEERLVPFRIGKVTAHCLEVHDLAVSKLAAGRLKDFEMVSALLKRGIARAGTLERRIRELPPNVNRESLRVRLKALIAEIR